MALQLAPGNQPGCFSVNPSFTISQLLQRDASHDTKFEMAFWTSYSLDVETLTFLLRMDFKPNMESTGVVHLLCDLSKISETMDLSANPEGLNKLQHLQSYCTISSQHAEGSFHPKILFLVAHNSILVFVSSANATNSGILSNQDLIGSFSSDDAYTDIRPEIVSIYNYLKSFDGWATSAMDELNGLLEHFPLLGREVPEADVITIPGTSSLLTQMADMQSSRRGLKQVNVFTPFLDPYLDAVFKIREKFTVPVNVISPQKEFTAARSDALPSDIKFYRSSGNGKSTFHAKCYEFEYEDESTLYWGSANCSLSGLISEKRNAEILIKSNVDKEYVNNLWGSLDAQPTQEITYVESVLEGTDSAENPDVILLSAAVEGDQIRIISKTPITKGVIKLHLTNETEEIIELPSKSSNEQIFKCPIVNPAVVYVEFEGQPVSNKLFLNHPSRIENRIKHSSSSGNVDDRKVGFDGSLESAFALFTVEAPRKSSQTSKSVGSYISKRFWTMPHYRQTFGIRSYDVIKDFINRRVLAYRERNDNENEDGKNRIKKSKLKSDDPKAVSEIKRLNKFSKGLTNTLYKFDSVDSFKHANLSNWFQGLDNINKSFLEHLEKTHFPRDYERYHQILYYLSSISTWMMNHDTSEIDGIEFSLDLIMNIQDLYLLLSIYKYLCPGRRTPVVKEREIREIKRALYLKFLVDSIVTNMQRSIDHREMTLESFGDDLFLKRIFTEAKSFLNAGVLTGLRDFPVTEVLSWKGRRYLVMGRDGSRVDLEWIVPHRKKDKSKGSDESQADELKLPVLADQVFRASHPDLFESIVTVR